MTAEEELLSSNQPNSKEPQSELVVQPEEHTKTLELAAREQPESLVVVLSDSSSDMIIAVLYLRTFELLNQLLPKADMY